MTALSSSVQSKEKAGEQRRLYLRGRADCSREGVISFDTQHWTGDGAALRDASASLCGSGQKHALVCTTVSVCECVNVSECVSQCLAFGHNALLFGCALPPRSSSTSVPTLQPHTSIQLSNPLFSPRIRLWLTCSFVRAFSLLLSCFFLFSLFMGFIEVFECKEPVLMRPLVQSSDRENVVCCRL